MGEAVLTACHVLNRVPTKNSEVSPLKDGKEGNHHSLLAYVGLFGHGQRTN